MDFRGYLKYFGWSQAEFARKVGVTPEAVSRWTGSPPKIYVMWLRERYERGRLKMMAEEALARVWERAGV